MRLNFPKYNFDIKKEGEKTYIFDILRKKYLVLGPEEMVRQHLIHFLIEERAYPKSKIKVEQSIKVLDLQRRIDLVIYSKDFEPILLAECKAPEIPIDQKVLDQIGRYNIAMKVPFLLLTNGLLHLNFRIDYKNNTFEPLKEIPFYNELISIRKDQI